MKTFVSELLNRAGDLLITQAGEDGPPKFFIVHWDAATTDFVIHGFGYKRADGSNGRFEHVTFAPLDLPTH